ncbi:hypothetical protein A3Q56_00846 [Intoshia linei]|uniref:Uncharacterized protein n=1 Tax=Intoshia linei TaxID=1819745 RepID=A0A177BCZ6_9BILA|nr:hypothetical protein A3Q56_00846 [Intoshia linei]
MKSTIDPGLNTPIYLYDENEDIINEILNDDSDNDSLFNQDIPNLSTTKSSLEGLGSSLGELDSDTSSNSFFEEHESTTIFSRLEECRESLEQQLGLEKFRKLYQHIQKHQRLDDSITPQRLTSDKTNENYKTETGCFYNENYLPKTLDETPGKDLLNDNEKHLYNEVYHLALADFIFFKWSDIVE